MKTNNIPATIDEYISTFPSPIQKPLKELRAVIQQAAPGAEERISYQMPMFYQKGVVVYFAAHTNHIGFYPGASGVKAFEKELSNYVHSKGTIQFPMDKPLPFALISKIVSFRVNENLEKAKFKAQKIKNKRKKKANSRPL
jgi:uncharacterized protein YdhG (YjbR/CyaY superfamily)